MESNKLIQKLAADFAHAAQRYCAEIDGRQQASSTEGFLMALHPLIAELYFRASVLPDLEPEREVSLEMTQNEWQQQFKSLEAMLGKYNLYWEVFDPKTKGGPIAGALADDLADIYGDIRPGLEALGSANGNISVDVIWDWRFGFISHWGHHAIDALRVIHGYAETFITDGWA